MTPYVLVVTMLFGSPPPPLAPVKGKKTVHTVILSNIMANGFQKSANNCALLDIPHPGILDAPEFYNNYDLRCYAPAPSLAPFVVHIWVQRNYGGQSTPKPLEIQTGANTYLYLSAHESFIQGVSSVHSRYDPRLPGIWAGVKFTPGGLGAFWPHSLSKLAGSTVPAETIFSELTTLQFRERLDHLDDATIVATLEQLLVAHSPQISQQLQDISRIMDMINSGDPTLTAPAIAHRIGKSERSLQQLFRHHVGASLKWTLMRRRLIGATERIAHTSEPLTDVALEYGYSSQSHFTSEFKSVTGRAPSSHIGKVRRRGNNYA